MQSLSTKGQRSSDTSSAVNGQLSTDTSFAVNGQLSTVNCQRSTFNGQLSTPRSASKIVKCNVIRGNTKIVKHLKYRCIHHRRTAEVVFNLFRLRMIFK